MTRLLLLALAVNALDSLLQPVLAASKRSPDSPKVLGLPFTKRYVPNPKRERLQRRQDDDEDVPEDAELVVLDHDHPLSLRFFVNVTVGEPPQQIVMHIDTGSSDIWVPSAGTDFCRLDECLGGTFSPRESETYELLQENTFYIEYGDGTEVLGDYFSDSFGMDDTFFVDDMTLILATELSGMADYPVMGIGYPSVQVASRDGQDYPNLVERMVEQDVINARAYSFFMNHIEEDVGHILFGGVDHNKFSGEMVTLPTAIDEDHGVVTHMAVIMSRMGLVDDDGDEKNSFDIGERVVLDTGAEHTHLPEELFMAVVRWAGALHLVSERITFVPCDFGETDSYLALELGEGGETFTLRVSAASLVAPFHGIDPELTRFADGRDGCSLGVSVSDGKIMFGTSFLRDSYMVFNLDQDTISVAQAQFGEDEENIVAIEKDGTIPPADIAAIPLTPAVFQAATVAFGAVWLAGTAFGSGL